MLLPTAALYAAALVWYLVQGRRSVLPVAPEEVAARIAAELAKGSDLRRAAEAAKRFITGAIRDSLEVGEGHGPVNPMWATSALH